MYFLGVGFLAGAIVHYPVNPSLYGAIGAVGAIIFTIASTLNEWITNKRHLLQEGVLKIVFYSLVLSIGLGMISGGIQHFIDFPIYASYLIPLGFIISLVGFVLTKEIKLDIQHKFILIAKLSLVSIFFFFILNNWAKTMDVSNSGHAHSNSSEQITHARVTNDEEFIFEMIPHHEEAIATSNYLLKNIENEILKKFANNVIAAQTSEVVQMKNWYKTWFGKEYETNNNYMPMMGDLTKFNDKDLEKAYIVGMIAHHEGAVMMAHQIQSLTQRPEIKKMATGIISVQSKEIEMLQNMLEGYEHTEDEH